MSARWQWSSRLLSGIFGRRRADHGSGRELSTLLEGYRGAALIYVAAKLGIADLLAAGPRSSRDLADTLSAHAVSLHRVLRGLTALRVCAEEQDGRFSITALGRRLLSDAPGSLRGLAILCGEEWAPGWGGLLHTVMTGETAFSHVFGMSQWEHRRQHPELDEWFSAWLAAVTAGAAAAVIAAYDFSWARSIADIGGGGGTLLASILQTWPSASGILFDRPSALQTAMTHLKAAGVTHRCRLLAGDFFESVPDGADLYILKSVIHDWDDDRSLTILRNCRSAMAAGARLLLVERVMPERTADNASAVWADVHMLAITGGRERTESEYRGLLDAAGLALNRTIGTRSAFTIFEAVPAASPGPA